MPTTAPALLARADQAIDRATEATITGKGFSLDKETYRQGYRELHDVYKKVVQAQEDIKARGGAVQPGRVSDRDTGIIGIRDGAEVARNAVDQSGSGSLLDALRTVEEKIARLLNDMHASYVAYQRTDQESSFNLFNGAAAP